MRQNKIRNAYQQDRTKWTQRFKGHLRVVPRLCLLETINEAFQAEHAALRDVEYPGRASHPTVGTAPYETTNGLDAIPDPLGWK